MCYNVINEEIQNLQKHTFIIMEELKMSYQVCEECNQTYSCPRAWENEENCPYDVAEHLFSMDKSSRMSLISQLVSLRKLTLETADALDTLDSSRRIDNDHVLGEFREWVFKRFDMNYVYEYDTLIRDTDTCQGCKYWCEEIDVCCNRIVLTRGDRSPCSQFEAIPEK